MNVFDSSALLAFLQGEAGADIVEEALSAGGVCGAANWSEVAQKVLANDRNWDMARALLASYELEVEAVTMTDAERAAQRWLPANALSLGDRLCLALADRLDAEVWTADRSWGTTAPVRQIR